MENYPPPTVDTLNFIPKVANAQLTNKQKGWISLTGENASPK